MSREAVLNEALYQLLDLVLFRVLLEGTGTNFNGSNDGKSGAGWF